MTRVAVGMSGGVDSAAAAYLLKEKGYDVVGVTLRTWVSADGEDSRCCEIDDAERAARKLGIRFFPLNAVSCFREKVERPFIDAYVRGMTPNPCVICNRDVKWERMLYAAEVVQAGLIATGHYAVKVLLDNGRYTVKRAAHAEKDQSYMLYRLTQEQLSATLFPLGEYSKEEVREIARAAGLPVAEKPDSQEICFVPDGDYARYITENADVPVPGEGHFVDADGTVLGTHKGIIHYTVGQRRGLGLPLGYPAYVKEIRAGSNEVVIAKEEELRSGALLCGSVCFMSIPGLAEGEELPCTVKIRYRHAGQSARISAAGDGLVKVVFDEPVRAAAPGQSAVFYDAEDCVVGGGIIQEVLRVQ